MIRVMEAQRQNVYDARTNDEKSSYQFVYLLSWTHSTGTENILGEIWTKYVQRSKQNNLRLFRNDTWRD